jgi:hypothetical protein
MGQSPADHDMVRSEDRFDDCEKRADIRAEEAEEANRFLFSLFRLMQEALEGDSRMPSKEGSTAEELEVSQMCGGRIRNGRWDGEVEVTDFHAGNSYSVRVM